MMVAPWNVRGAPLHVEFLIRGTFMKTTFHSCSRSVCVVAAVMICGVMWTTALRHAEHVRMVKIENAEQKDNGHVHEKLSTNTTGAATKTLHQLTNEISAKAAAYKTRSEAILADWR